VGEGRKTINTFEINKGYFRVHYNNTTGWMFVDEHRDFSNLLEPEYIYQRCQATGKTPEDTIDIMLKLLHKRRIFKGDWLADMSLCIALIGTRGSGKSAGMTGITVLDGLLAGRRVVSNLPIAVEARYRDCSKVFRTDSLDAALMLDVNEFNENYYDCLICVDEVNAYLADSQRSMTNQALAFSYILQQMRHRKLDFIFTTQAENMQTNRMRFQTDFYIQCKDMAMSGGQPKRGDIGRRSQWKMHDMSGLVTGEVTHSDNTKSQTVPSFNEKVFWNTPFWNCYDTAQMQKREKFTRDQEEATGFNPEKLEEIQRTHEAPVRLVSEAVKLGLERIDKASLWENLGIVGDASMQTKVGKIMLDIGCKTIEGTKGREYMFPSQAAMAKNLAKLGLKIIDEEGDNHAGRKH